MNKSIYTIGFIVLVLSVLYMALKILETIILLFFKGMLMVINYPVYSMAILALLTLLTYSYIRLTEK